MAALSRIETGSQRLTDTETVKEGKCGCNPSYYYTEGPRTLRRVMLYVPRQTHYPLYFVADVQAVTANLLTQPAGRTTAMLVATKGSPSQPWRLAMQVWDSGYVVPQEVPRPPIDAEGYGKPSSPSVAATRGWVPQLVAYFNQIKQTGRQPVRSGFTPGPLTSKNGLEAHPEGYTADGSRTTYTFRPGTFGGPWALNINGNTMVCGDIVEEMTTKPIAHRVLLQPSTRRGWGPDLAPGLYDSITSLLEWPVCLYRQGNKLGVTGNLGGGYVVTSSGHRVGRL